MPKNRYNILVEKSDARDSPVNQEDLSLTLESSLVLSGTKYPEPRTRISFSFVSASELGVIKLFFVTITHSRSSGEYYGFDSSESCVVIFPNKLNVGRRYEIYGRLEHKSRKVLYCISAKEICYRRLCYEIF
ncbi:hypothetical protein EHEL_110890 [Encephalitozoon hellem ATCC 50504]|uniref:Uncharacterized protein n=1 Tax=Encephalitozoon hellem TaxID=27973 RepID=A0A9Q9CCL4_ENCHE|nr:uncharacterized protein EHEL_110890 [Encephalitozoon hellem ATCC 50504]AFM99363.1 hypothetical protein EHEL_110890 [Encephalitozoon hellem ATCC 50504]UTX44368.1 hypothetical protein GPU96_11g21700 [Encephalitozoon hellem]|eukprot:XP_003888344.1 hypothetical protein EHEL_110890 [Encephalitozoon hellem ATCC 50504]